MTNLGLQNNNAGNLKDPTTGNFQVFKSPDEGYKALVSDLEYKKSGQSPHIKPGAPLSQLATVWAPASDNNVPSDWANNVSKATGYSIDTPFDKIPTDTLAKGIQVAEGTSTPSKNSTSNPTTSNSASKPQLTHEQLVGNINAMEQQGAKPQEIQGYLDSLKNSSQNNEKTKTTENRKTFKDILGEQDNSDKYDLKAGDPITAGKEGQNFTDSPVGKGILDFIGGGKLAQGFGYALSNAAGTQDKLIESQDQGAEVQKGLIQRIKENKAVGRDTTRLQKALDDLNKKQEKVGNSVSDAGTGGITNKEVLLSAGHLASNAALAYGAGALPKLLKGSKALAHPEVTKILEGAVGKGETIANLSRQEAVTTLENYLKEMSVSESGGKIEQAVLKTLKELSPTLVEKQGLLSKGAGLAKGILNQGAGYLVGQVAGSTGRNIYNHLTK